MRRRVDEEFWSRLDGEKDGGGEVWMRSKLDEEKVGEEQVR